jgi:hypothetical protein
VSVQAYFRLSVRGGFAGSVQAYFRLSVQGGFASSVQGRFAVSVQGGFAWSVQGGCAGSVRGDFNRRCKATSIVGARTLRGVGASLLFVGAQPASPTRHFGGRPTTWESTAVLGRVQVRRVAPPLQAPAATWTRPARGGSEAVVVGPPAPSCEESPSRSRTLHRRARYSCAWTSTWPP